MSIKKIFIWFLVYFFFASQVWAVTYTVDGTNGTDSGTCVGASPSTECKTIQYVFDNEDLDPNDIVEVEDGTYREQVSWGSNDIGTSGNPIILRGKSGHTVIIAASDLETSWTEEVLGAEDFSDDAANQAIWYLEEAADTTRYDQTANNNDLEEGAGDSIDRTSTHKQGSYAIDFDAASTEQLTIADSSLSSNFPGKDGTSETNITFGCWIYPESDTSGYVMHKGGGGNTAFALNWDSGTDKWRIEVDVSGSKSKLSTNTASTGAWVHVVGRFDNANDIVDIFVDGSKQGTGTAATGATIGTDNDEFVIGQHSNGSSSFDGYVDECFVRNDALTDANISSIYANGYDGGGGSGSAWYASGYTTEPEQVFEDGARMTEQTGTCPDDLSAGEWCYDSGNDRVYIRTTGDDNPSGYDIEIGQRLRAIYLESEIDYVTIQNLTVKHGQYDGIGVQDGSDGVTIISVISEYNYRYGIEVWDDTTGPQNGTITLCTVRYNGSTGIEFGTLNSGWTASFNDVHHNAQYIETEGAEFDYTAGIRAVGSTVTNLIITQNKVYNNGISGDGGNVGDGVWADSVGSGVLISFNDIFDNNRRGIEVENSDGVLVYGNKSYGHTQGAGLYMVVDPSQNSLDNNEAYFNTFYANNNGILMSAKNTDASCSGNKLINNISYANVSYELFIQDDCESGTTISGNSFGAAESGFISWDHDDVDSYSELEDISHYNGDTKSVESNCSMTNPSSDDFTLTLTSECIGAGVPANHDKLYPGFIAGASGNNLLGPVLNLPDVGAYEFPSGGAF